MRRKISYKKNFYGGLLLLAIGLAHPLLCLLRMDWGDFGWKDGLIAGFLVLTGCSMVLRSLDPKTARADRDEDRDERNRWIELRSRALCCRVLFWLILAGFAGCAVGYGISGDEVYIHMATPLLLLYLAALLLRLISWIYFEKRE